MVGLGESNREDILLGELWARVIEHNKMLTVPAKNCRWKRVIVNINSTSSTPNPSLLADSPEQADLTVFSNPCTEPSAASSSKVLGLCRKRSGAMSFKGDPKSERRAPIEYERPLAFWTSADQMPAKQR
jgi:hypothetical protein